ncbi:MAG: 23S rRNA pseudouridine(2604) synthase RluF [Flavobacteriales bacterium]|jgi:23S rRNA pseudouridine2604 synthase
MRINKFISESGLCSRREADKFIERGLVTINGKKVGLGAEVGPRDVVKVNGRGLNREEKQDLVLAFNKPIGVVSTTDKVEKNNIVDYISYSERIFPIGRLDKDSQGLILLTNNGDLVNKILRAGNKNEKEYVVSVDRPLFAEFAEKMSQGVPILGVQTRRCKVVVETPFVFRITLIQGLNRQIRRMCEHFGYNVTKLERTRIMHIGLQGLQVGEFRPLEEEELRLLNKYLEKSKSEAPEKKAAADSDKPKPKPKPRPKPRTSSSSASPSSSKPRFKAGSKSHAKPGERTFRNGPSKGSSSRGNSGKSSRGGAKRTGR